MDERCFLNKMVKTRLEVAHHHDRIQNGVGRLRNRPNKVKRLVLIFKKNLDLDLRSTAAQFEVPALLGCFQRNGP